MRAWPAVSRVFVQTVAVSLPLAWSAAPARAIQVDAIEVEGWTVSFPDQLGVGGPVTFSDDFEDGVFPGFPAYVEPCGSVEAGDEGAGRLSLGARALPAGSVPGCQGEQIVSFAAVLAGEANARGRFVFEVPAPGKSYGLRLSKNLGAASALEDAISISVLRLLGGFTAVAVTDETGATTESSTLSDAQIAALADGETIELELVLTDDSSALLPSGRFRFGNDPFEELTAIPEPPVDGGALNRFQLHSASLFASVPEPTTALLLTTGLLGLGLAGSRRA